MVFQFFFVFFFCHYCNMFIVVYPKLVTRWIHYPIGQANRIVSYKLTNNWPIARLITSLRHHHVNSVSLHELLWYSIYCWKWAFIFKVKLMSISVFCIQHTDPTWFALYKEFEFENIAVSYEKEIYLIDYEELILIQNSGQLVCTVNCFYNSVEGTLAVRTSKYNCCHFKCVAMTN